jgi:isopenicillin-N N-acyltransferase like protein
MPSEKPYYRKKRFLIPGLLLIALAGLIAWYHLETRLAIPQIKNPDPLSYVVKEPDSGLFTCNGSWLQHSTSGLWEMYLRGGGFERGTVNGKLTEKLLVNQEEVFISRICKMVPSLNYLKFLKYFTYWFNRDLEEYLTEEYKEEIYGISFSLSHRFDFIGTPYHRMMNYQSAHDIGHALQDLTLVECTSFGVWDEYSADSSLIIGRNFDFYMGDDFAKNKIVAFVKPDSGYSFMMVTWPGMIGAVSGMNTKGITVTINAAKSDVPWSARTPISILAREILQYARTIREAYAIAQKRETFVSESILIGSAYDHKAAIIEKSPARIDLVMPERDMIVCSNHFQGEVFREDPLNRKNMQQSSSLYRYRRLKQLIETGKPVDAGKAAAILRDRRGLNGADIGMGNEKALNQLIAHHSVIFMPEKQLAWVSAGPWQAGTYICYDLNRIFNTFASLQHPEVIEEEALNIPADPFLGTTDYVKFLKYKVLRDSIQNWLRMKEPLELPRSYTDEFISLNPYYYEGYMLTGDLFVMDGNDETALTYYGRALKCEIPSAVTREEIIGKMSKCIVRTREK